jgi:uncharacterized protein GlcG (DUF336 family)
VTSGQGAASSPLKRPTRRTRSASPASRCRPRISIAQFSLAAVFSVFRESNPVNVDIAYGGSPSNYGQANDPMVGGRIGGVNVFGGGLGLYNSSGVLVGAIGVSGDTSCADHNIAWRTRHAFEP